MKHRIIAASAGAKVAAIIQYTNIEAVPIRVRQTVMAMGITWRKQEILIINCYAPPRDDVKEIVQEIEEILDTVSYEKIILLGDINAKSTVWGAVRQMKQVESFPNSLFQKIGIFGMILSHSRPFRQ